MKHIFLRQESLSARAWHLLKSILPLAIYGAISIGVMILCMMGIFLLRLSPGASPEELSQKYTLVILGISAMVSILVFVRWIGRGGEYGSGHREQEISSIPQVLAYVILGVSAAIFLNTVITVADLFRFSPSYERVSDSLYGGFIYIQILVTGFLVPVAEEIVFRGAMLNRMSLWLTSHAAVLASALLFGLYHGNLVQFLYGTLMGILFAYAIIETGDMTIPILMHIGANVCILLLGTGEMGTWIMTSFARELGAIAVSAMVGLGCFYYLHRVK